MNSKADNNPGRCKMDGETAMAFAGNEFERLHPRETCPAWLPRCTAIGYSINHDGYYVVYFTVTKKGADQSIVYFNTLVNARTAEVTVLVDSVPTWFDGHELIGF